VADPSPAAPPRRRLGLTAEGPSIMGIVNATTDSFSDGGDFPTLDARVALADRLVADGATVLDVGGESGRTDKPAADPLEERDVVAPLVAEIRRRHPDVAISVDTYKPLVADAALAAGADCINDISGLLDPELADVAAAHDAGLILMHTRSRPKEKLLDPARYDDVVADVCTFLREKVELAVERGVDRGAIVVDPGLDFAKTPAQTIEVLRRIDEVTALGHPVLVAVSRKDFIGALTEAGPRERLAGTLAAIAHLAPRGDFTYRVHDVREARDFLTVLECLAGDDDVDPELTLAEHLRRSAS
jgi:dihydropteroate synthase